MRKPILTFILAMVAGWAMAAGYSGTLPVMFITTDGGQAITSKTDYINATFYIDALGLDNCEPVGSKAEPVSMRIRGRGNVTWTGLDKKSYKLKLDEGLPLLGMGQNKHFALIAHADSKQAFLKEALGFELAKMLDMEFTPQHQPVEVVLNGDYIGLYSLTETIRLGKRRVNIAQQVNGESDPYRLTGGWLVEIDNYDSDSQLRFPTDDLPLENFRITYHDPDSLSVEQTEFLSSQMQQLLSTVYAPQKNTADLDRLVDIESLARFYLVNELVDNVESFLGSCFMYRDRGYDEKWKFGPVWDFGNALTEWHGKNNFIYQTSIWPKSIIEEMMNFHNLKKRVLELWFYYYDYLAADWYAYILDYADRIAEATKADHERWPMYAPEDIGPAVSWCLEKLDKKKDFLEEWWGAPDKQKVADITVRSEATSNWHDLWGRPVVGAREKGIYIKDKRKVIVR
ncbi:MAG: CotH kinase family protein [Prevotella sp.]|nr:CotH kinase family protein [Prevotella sp.]